MRILFFTKRMPDVTNDQIAAMRIAEAEAVWKLVVSGFLRDINYCPDAPAVIGIVEAADLETARTRLCRLPMSASGLIDFDLYVLQPYDQFALLFSGKPD